MNMFKALLLVFLLLPTSMSLAEPSPILGHRIVGTGPVKVIVLHDWMGDMSNYDGVIPWLDREQFSYIFTDIRGYGLSSGIPGQYHSDEISGDIMTLANHLGLAQFHLVGHSMNGLAGFKTILTDWQKDKRVKSFVAVSPVTPNGYPASEDDKSFLYAAISDDKTAHAAFTALTGGKLGNRWAVIKTLRNRTSSRADVLQSYYKMWLEEDFSISLASAQVGTPVLVIGGRNDLPGFQEPYYKETIAKWMPNIEFTFIDNAGHYPMEETPVLFSHLLQQYVASKSQ